jgi:hypothetical protein
MCHLVGARFPRAIAGLVKVEKAARRCDELVVLPHRSAVESGMTEGLRKAGIQADDRNGRRDKSNVYEGLV